MVINKKIILVLMDTKDSYLSFAKYINDWYEYSDHTDRGVVLRHVVTGKLLTEYEIFDEWYLKHS